MKKLKKLVACLLAALTLLSTMSSNVFAAFNDKAGMTCTSEVTGYYVGSDGKYYVYGNQIVHRMVYNSDSTFRYYEVDKGIPDVTSTVNAMEKYQMVDSSGNTRVAYCIEAGMEFVEADGFVSSSYSNSTYYKLLPDKSAEGIFYTLLYGYSEGKSSPVNGTNIDDYRFATQVIIWEYQHQVRTDATTRKNHSFLDNDTKTTKTIPADEFYNDLKGRPAEKCYNWILNQIKYHTVRPSFTYGTNNDAKKNPYTMKYDSSTKKYSITLTDTSNTGKDIKMKDGRMTVTRNGNKYTITCPTKIAVPQSVTSYKDVTTAPQMLVWGKPGAQTVATGASDPFAFYLYLNTEPDGTLKIAKTSEDGKISGVTFTISGNGQQSRTVTTGTDGTVSVTLLPGTYTVTENAANKYVKPANQTVTITGGNTTTATFNNKLKRGTLKVTKTAEDGLIEGIKFKLSGTSLSGNKVEQYATTNAQGIATFENVLISGSTPYSLEEVNTASKYVVPAKQTAAIEWNKVTNKSFYNELKRGSLKVTKTAEDGLVSGIKFKLSGTSLSGQKVEQYATTNAQGIATFENVLISGSTPYSLEEVNTASKYVVPAKQTAAIEWNKVTNKSFYNELKRGSLKVTKTAEDGLVSGIKFKLSGTSLSGQKVEQYATTNAQGVATFSNVLISGSTPYTLEEVNTADKYIVPASQTAIIEWNKVTSKSFHNELKKFNVTITKTDSETGTAQGEGTLEGAVYGLYKAGTLVEQLVIDSTGKAVSGNHPCGDDYTIREIKAPEGYELDTTEYKVDATAGSFTAKINSLFISVTENVIKGSIAIIKHSDDGSTQIDTPEEGAIFEIYLKSAGSYDAAADSEKDIITTDEYGYAQTKDLPYGTYTVHQTAGLPNREFIRDFDVVISADKTYRYLINNADFYSYVRIVKTDAETGETVPYAGAGFKIYDPDGNPVSFRVTYPEFETIDTFYTSSDGTLITPDVLPSGEGYSIVEVEAPEGYVLNSEPVYFDVTRGGSEDFNGINVVTVTRDNMPQKGQIMVKKTGEVFFSVVKENGVYKPIYEVRAFADAVYEIYAAEDITTPDGTVRYNQGELVDTLTTGADGTDTSKELYLGTYEVVEAKAPYGLLIDPTPKQVTLTYAGENVFVTNAETEAYNERQKLVISGLKSMEQDDIFGVGTGEELLDVTFGLYAAEDITAADGSVIPADGLIEVINVALDGTLQVTADLPFGSYYLQEITTNNSYVLDVTKYPVEFAYTGEDIPTVEIVINDGEAIVNKLFYGSILGFKTDLKGNPLNGAVFGLFAPNEADLSVENALMTVTSDDEGKFIFEKIPCGTYLIAELEAPEGYVRDEDVITVTVTQDMEETEPVTIVNKPEPSPDCGVPGVPLAVYGAVAAASGAVAAGAASKKRRKKK